MGSSEPLGLDALSAALERVNAAVAIVNESLIVLYANDAFVQMWKYAAKSDIIGKPARLFAKQSEMLAAAARWIEQGDWSGRLTGIRKGGLHFPMEVKATRTRGSAGQIYFIGSITDLTDRERLVGQLVASERKLREAHRTFDLAFGELDCVSGQFLWSPEALTILGWKSRGQNLDFQELLKIIHPDDRQKIHQAYLRAITQGDSTPLHYRIVLPGGEIRWIRAVARTIEGPDGTPQKMLGALIDSTGIERIGEELHDLALGLESRFLDQSLELRRERDFADQVLDTVHAIIVVLDHSGRTVRSNLSARHFFGVQATLQNSRFVEYAIAEECRGEFLAAIESLHSTGGHIQGECRWLAATGIPFDAKWAASCLLDLQGAVEYIIVTATDVPALREAEQHARRALTAAEHANKSKSEFQAVMNHELRTPLASIISSAQMLINRPEYDRSLIEIIQHSSTHLLRLVNEILTFSSIEAGALKLNYERFDLIECIEQVLIACRQSYGTPMTVGELDLKDEFPNHFYGDQLRFRQVLYNLVSNAFKFCESGNVRISVAWSGPERAGLTVLVKDSGPGIPLHFRDRIFAPFTQGNMSTTRKHAGTGLGLSLSRELARLMGGEVRLLQGEPGATIFSFQLAARPCEIWMSGARSGRACSLCIKNLPVPVTDALPADVDREMKILIVEDNPINSYLLKRMLEEDGLRNLRTAATGSEALTRLAHGRLDLVFLDMHLPDIDGIQVVQRFRSASGGTPEPAFVALTADVSPATHENCLRNGIAEFLSKPIDRERLRSALWKHGRRQRRHSNVCVPPP